jgi:hypothetical protein
VGVIPSEERDLLVAVLFAGVEKQFPRRATARMPSVGMTTEGLRKLFLRRPLFFSVEESKTPSHKPVKP